LTEQEGFQPTAPGSRQARIESALAARLRSVAPYLLDMDLPPADPDPAMDAAEVLDLVVSSVAASPTNDRIWLLLTAVGAAYPTRSEVDAIRRELELLDRTAAVVSLLDAGLVAVSAEGNPDAVIDIVSGGVLVDVDHGAKHELHTGIQQVTRSLLPIWTSQRDVVPAAWTRSAGSLRRLSEPESQRMTSWSTRQSDNSGASSGGHDGPDTARCPVLLVPWRSVIVMLEVPPFEALDRVAAIGDYSGNRLVGVAYDAIPVTSADMVPPTETSRFVRYLTAVKFASRMAGISAAATAEIAGFVEAVASQGIQGPLITEIALPSEPPRRPGRTPSTTGNPAILVVGSHEPRKNHLAILHSAEILWRAGIRFTLTFIGGSGWGEEFPRRIAELQEAGRPVQVLRAVPEKDLEKAYTSASFTVFPSLHEGFGLPVAESLSYGTPVITSNFGSTAEIGRHGGTLLIDPRDNHALTNAIRTLLREPETLQRLRSEIATRPTRNWQNYADELWTVLVQPELTTLRGDTADVDPIDR